MPGARRRVLVADLRDRASNYPYPHGARQGELGAGGRYLAPNALLAHSVASERMDQTNIAPKPA